MAYAYSWSDEDCTVTVDETIILHTNLSNVVGWEVFEDGVSIGYIVSDGNKGGIYEYTPTTLGTHSLTYGNVDDCRPLNVTVVSPKISLRVKLDNIFQLISNKVTSWSSTPSDDNYPSEKLVKDSLDGKASISDLSSVATSGSYNDLSNKPTIPSASSTTPSADTTNGSVGTGTTWARSNHTHPKSSLYAESSHTHTVSNITDFPTIPSKTSDLTNDGDGTNVFVKNNDSRLSDARTPTSHTHGNVSNDGKISNLSISISQNDYPVMCKNDTGEIIKGSVLFSTKIINQNELSNINVPNKSLQSEINDAIDTSIGTINTSLNGKANISHTHSEYLTSHQPIKTINNNSLIGTGNVDLNIPTYTSHLSNNGASGDSKYIEFDDVINNLTSTSSYSDVPLSAYQGKVLKDLVDGKANSTHNHSISDVTDLQTTLNGKANSSHTHTYDAITLTNISTNIDYNDYTTQGFYKIWYANQSGNTNKPTTDGGLLIVNTIPNGHFQIFIPYANQNNVAPKHLYYRTHYESGNTNTWSKWEYLVGGQDIVDNLTTDDATKVLSAKQGKVLNDLIGDAIEYINQ